MFAGVAGDIIILVSTLNTQALQLQVHLQCTVLTRLFVQEEAAYCDPGLISEVVVPLLSMSNSVLL